MQRSRLYLPVESDLIKRLEATLIDGTPGTVASFVPDTYESYVRIFHPAGTLDGSPVTWAEVAASTGRAMGATSHWSEIASVEAVHRTWPAVLPSEGSLPLDLLSSLCELLKRHSTPRTCFLGYWEGWASTNYEDLLQHVETSDGQMVGTVPLPIAGAHMQVPPDAGRDYLIICGPVTAAAELLDLDLTSTSPQLMWPSDCCWFVASDIDLDSTLVGGEEELITFIIESDEFEARRIQITDAIGADLP